MHNSKVYNHRINRIESVSTLERESERKELQSDVDRFLESGGKIEVIPLGQSSMNLKLSKHNLTVIHQTANYKESKK
jgi:hypothetical protein